MAKDPEDAQRPGDEPVVTSSASASGKSAPFSLKTAVAVVVLMIAEGVVLIIVMSGGGFWQSAAPQEEMYGPTASLPPLTIPLKPESDADANHYLQCTIALEIADKGRKEAVKELIESRGPHLKNMVISEISKLTYRQVRRPDTKKDAAKKILEKVNHILGSYKGRDQIKSVLWEKWFWS